MIQSTQIERWYTGLKAEWRAFLLKPQKHALYHALSVVVAIYTALQLGIPDPFWAGISALVVFNTDYSGNIAKCVQRFIGTAVGALAGLLFLFFLSSTLFPFLGCLIFVCLLGFYLIAISKSPYVFILGLVTFIMVIATDWTNLNSAYSTAVYRTTEVSIGIVVSCLFSSFYTATDFKSWLRVLFYWPKINWFEWVHPIMHPSSSEKMFAIKGTLAILGIPTLWIMLNLPGLEQVVISIIAVIQLDPQKTAAKGFQRLAGCGLGFVAVCIVLSFSIDHILPFLIVMYLVLCFFIHLQYGNAEVNYAGIQASVAFILGVVSGLGPVHNFEVVFERFIGIFTAVFILWLMDYIWPWPSKSS